MSANLKYIRWLFLAVFFVCQSAQANRRLFDFPKAYKETRLRFFPIPIFENDPASGQRYGLMPTFLWVDQRDQLATIGVGALTYNPKVVKLGGFLGFFVYPSSDEALRLFIRESQNFENDYYLQYVNETGLDYRLDAEVELEYYQNPFERFFGFGPNSSSKNESNFVSHVWMWKGRVAYEFLPEFHVQLVERWSRMSMNPKALTSLKDTGVFFAGAPEIRSSNQWQHRGSIFWDTRDAKDLPTVGHFLETTLLLSHEPFDSATFYYGYGLLGKKYLPLTDHFTTVGFLRLEEFFGDRIPFFMQPNLGGGQDLRGYIERRFTGKGRMALDLEERILVKHWHFMGVKFDFGIDPFLSAGQVFDRWGQVNIRNVKLTGGVGFRAKVPPAVVGRVDIAAGDEGVQVMTTLDYPF